MTPLARFGLIALLAVGCAARKEAPPAAAPASAEPAPEDGAAEPGATSLGPAKKSEEVAPGGFAQPALASLDEAEARLADEAARLDTALATARDCAVAHKALESMKRSRDRICALNGPDDPGGRCARARARVEAASEDLKRGCGS